MGLRLNNYKCIHGVEATEEYVPFTYGTLAVAVSFSKEVIPVIAEDFLSWEY